jgi:hypothetical protein
MKKTSVDDHVQQWAWKISLTIVSAIVGVILAFYFRDFSRAEFRFMMLLALIVVGIVQILISKLVSKIIGKNDRKGPDSN